MKNQKIIIAATALTVAFFVAVSMLSFYLTNDNYLSEPDNEILMPDSGTASAPTPLPEQTPVIPNPEPDEPETPDAPEDIPETPVPKATYVRSKVNGLNIRSAPTTSASSLGYIDKGDMVAYKGTEGNWYITEYKNKTAYIRAGTTYTELFETELSSDPRIESVIEEGYKLLGFPYVYGAVRLHNGNGVLLSNFDKTKFDCSSLMQYIFYYGAGVNLNQTTRTQVSQGVHVPKSEISRGDLIFFTNSSRYDNTGIERIGHVALYLGENYILHTASDYAVIEEISSQRWSYYIETRRMI